MFVRKVNGKLPDDFSGNVETGTVTSVNGVSPDLTGDVSIASRIPNGKFMTADELFSGTFLEAGTHVINQTIEAEIPLDIPFVANVSIVDVEGMENYYAKIYVVSGLDQPTRAKIKMQVIDNGVVIDEGVWVDYTIDLNNLPEASVNQKGVVQLTNSYLGTSEVLALTQNAGSEIVTLINDMSIVFSETMVTSVNNIKPDGDGNVTIPVASDTVSGLVKVDNDTITIDENGVVHAVDKTIQKFHIDDTVTPATAPSTFPVGTTQTVPNASIGNPVYMDWVKLIEDETGLSIPSRASWFGIEIKTVKSNNHTTYQTINVIMNDTDNYQKLISINRRSFNSNGQFLNPGVEMTTIRGSGNPEDSVYGYGGNMYYDSAEKEMYYKTDTENNAPTKVGWISFSNSDESLAVDDVTIKNNTGVISAPTVPVQDDNITSSTVPTAFAHEHTITIVADNGFRRMFENVTGGSLEELSTNFVINTYKKPNASGFYKYYQHIDVYIGDSFNNPNLAARVYRNSNQPNNWGFADRIVVEPIQRTTNTTLFPIDYTLVGSTLHDTRTNISYIAVKGTEKNPITCIWEEVRSVDVRERYDISLLPRDYRLGVSESYLASSNDGYPELLSAMNSFFGWNVTSGDVVFYTRTNRNSQGEVLQTVDIYFTKLHAGRRFGTMSRASSSSQSFFGAWRGETVVHYGLEQPSGTQYGMKGNLYINAVTGVMYRMSNASNNVPTWDGWNPITTVVLNTISEAIPEEEGVDFVYSAEQTVNLIGNHAHLKASENVLGHVKVDGETITINEEGVISSVGGNKTPLSDNYKLSSSHIGASTIATADLYDDMMAHDSEIIVNLNDHKKLKASNTVLGHVKIDEDTIVSDAEGKISVNFTPITNELTTLGGESATHMAQISTLNTSLDTHIETIASAEDLGHVRIDDETITINELGVISVAEKEYKLDVSYHRIPVLEEDDEFIVPISPEDYADCHLEVYDGGVLILETYDYTYSYDEVEEVLKFNWIPKHYNTKAIVKLTKVVTN